MCFVYVYSCICVCTCMLLSPRHTLPHWQLGKTWHWGKTERAMEKREIEMEGKDGLKGKGKSEERCFGGSQWHTAGEWARGWEWWRPGWGEHRRGIICVFMFFCLSPAHPTLTGWLAYKLPGMPMQQQRGTTSHLIYLLPWICIDSEWPLPAKKKKKILETKFIADGWYSYVLSSHDLVTAVLNREIIDREHQYTWLWPKHSSSQLTFTSSSLLH